MGKLIFVADTLFGFIIVLLSRVLAVGILLIALGLIYIFSQNVSQTLYQLDQQSPLAPLTKIGLGKE